jgi:hypothetical protein
LVSDPFNFLPDADNSETRVHGCVGARPDWSGSWSLDKSQEVPNRETASSGRLKTATGHFVSLHKDTACAESNGIFSFSYQKCSVCFFGPYRTQNSVFLYETQYFVDMEQTWKNMLPSIRGLLHVSCGFLAWFPSPLKKEVTYFSKTSVEFQQRRRLYIPPKADISKPQILNNI